MLLADDVRDNTCEIKAVVGPLYVEISILESIKNQNHRSERDYYINHKRAIGLVK